MTHIIFGENFFDPDFFFGILFFDPNFFSGKKYRVGEGWHESSSWVELRLHTEHQLPGYSGSGLKYVGTLFYGFMGYGFIKINKCMGGYESSSWVELRLHIKNQFLGTLEVV